MRSKGRLLTVKNIKQMRKICLTGGGIHSIIKEISEKTVKRRSSFLVKLSREGMVAVNSSVLWSEAVSESAVETVVDRHGFLPLQGSDMTVSAECGIFPKLGGNTVYSP